MPTAAVRPEPEFRQLTAEGREVFLDAALRVFHTEYEGPSGAWGPVVAVVEPERFFGFAADDRWVATCGAFSRAMTVPGGRAVPIAGVTFVTVSPAYRRRGLLTRMMQHQLDEVHRRGEPIALLWASEAPIYGRFGYGSAAPRLHLSGSTDALAFSADAEVADGWVEDATRERYAAAVPAVHERLRATRAGALDRPGPWWDRVLHDTPEARHGSSGLRFALHHDADGEVDGYALYRITGFGAGGDRSGIEAQIAEMSAATVPAHAALWRYLLDLDLVRRVSVMAPVDEPLRYLVADQRAIEARLVDSVYLRIVDVRAALEARTYAVATDVVLGLTDRNLVHNAGSFRLLAGPDGATVSRVDAPPDVEMDIRELGAAYLGGTSLRSLHLAGLVRERTPGTVAGLARAFETDVTPFCPDFF